MKILYSSIMVIFCGFGYSLSVDPSSYHEIDLGRNYPTGLYDKYADAGFSARYSFSRAFKRKNTLREGLFKWQVGVQYIHFRSDYWTDEYMGASGNPLNDVEIKNYLANILNEFLEPIREKRKYFESNMKLVEEALDKGVENARKSANETMELVRDKMKVSTYKKIW